MLSTYPMWKSLTLTETLPALNDYHQHFAGGLVWMSWTIHIWQSEGLGFESPSGRDIFCLKNCHTLKRTSVHVFKINAVAQLTFQTKTLFKKYLHRQSQSSKTWDSKCLALIAQMVRAFSVNPKVGGLSPPQVETFSVSKKLWHFQKNIHSCVENECCCLHTVNISNVNFTSKIFDKCQHRLAAVTPTKHECDSMNLTYTFVEKNHELGFSTPHLWWTVRE